MTFSNEEFLVKLDRKDKGKTKAALPTRMSAKSTELTPIGVPGLWRKVTGDENYSH